MYPKHQEIPAEVQEGETLDYLPGGGLKFLQKREGYRFSLPSLLLAAFVRTAQAARLVDLGTGSGVIALLLARRPEVIRVVGVEIQEELADLARRNANLNGLADKVEILLADIRGLADLSAPESFDAVVCNPPYFPTGKGRLNPHPQKALARHEIAVNLGDCLAAASHLLSPSGKVNIICPAGRLSELLLQMRHHGFTAERLLVVHSRSGEPGEFVLVEGSRKDLAELLVMPPLFIWKREGGYTEQMVKIFAGLAGKDVLPDDKGQTG